MFGLGLPETIIVVGVAAVVYFSGGQKLNEIARSFGRFTGEFKKGKAEMEKEFRKAEKENK